MDVHSREPWVARLSNMVFHVAKKNIVFFLSGRAMLSLHLSIFARFAIFCFNKKHRYTQFVLVFLRIPFFTYINN